MELIAEGVGNMKYSENIIAYTEILLNTLEIHQDLELFSQFRCITLPDPVLIGNSQSLMYKFLLCPS